MNTNCKTYYLTQVLALSFLVFLVGACASMRRSSETDQGLSDFALNNKINLELFADNVEILGNICFQVFEGKVLLACSVAKEQEKKQAEAIVRKIKGVSKVYNHIQVGKNEKTVDTVNDAYISMRLGLSLMVMGNILRDHYVYEVHNGIVYLLGKSPHEKIRRQVIDAARGISGVEKVVSYISLTG
jgi:osmotically-inducible protein OsmY